jgi:hypothetical protein
MSQLPENQGARIGAIDMHKLGNVTTSGVGVIDTHRLGELRERFPQMSALIFGPPAPTPEEVIAERLREFIKQGPE